MTRFADRNNRKGMFVTIAKMMMVFGGLLSACNTKQLRGGRHSAGANSIKHTPSGTVTFFMTFVITTVRLLSLAGFFPFPVCPSVNIFPGWRSVIGGLSCFALFTITIPFVSFLETINALVSPTVSHSAIAIEGFKRFELFTLRASFFSHIAPRKIYAIL